MISAELDKQELSRAREAAARIRAARNYADLTQTDLADRMGLSLATIKRMESGQRPISTDELLHVGEACNFPTPFMLHGRAAITDVMNGDAPPAPCAARFAEIEARLASIEAALRRVNPPEA